MYDAQRFEDMSANNGEPAHRVTRGRFWEMLEIMWPRRWDRSDDAFEFFSVDEPWTGSACGQTLYTFCVRFRIDGEDHYFEMISPENATRAELMLKVQQAMVQP